MKMRVGDKANRILVFLMGLNDGAIAAVMGSKGMSAEDLDEGWTLLRGLGRRRLSTRVSPLEVSLRDQLDEWENYWYPIIDAVLLRHFPVVHQHVFLNLSQADASQVVFSVTTLLERLDALTDTSKPWGEDGPKALAKLATRMVDESALSPARQLLTELSTFAPDPDALTEEQTQAELDEAERLAWGWYLEWSRIARVAIKSRRMLRKLGFLDSKGKKVLLSDEADDHGTDDDDAVEARNEQPAQLTRPATAPLGGGIGTPGSSPFME